jgi:hypothetical protein
MSLKTVEQVLKVFGESRRSNYHWYNWGEPLLYKELSAFAETVKNTRTTISSNFSLKLPDSTFDILSKFEHIVLSMSGLTEEIYGIYHQRGNFNLVMENFHRLYGFKKVSIHWVQHKYNKFQYENCRALCEEMGFYFAPLRPNCEVEERIEGIDNELLKSPRYYNAKRMQNCRLMNWVPISIDGDYLLCCTTHNVKTGYTIWDNISQDELKKIKGELPLCKTCHEHEYWRMF